MGSMQREEGRKPSESLKQQKVPAIYLSSCEVTQEQYSRVMGAIPAQTWVGATLPVHNVNWFDAVAFCERLSAVENRRYRLPTEAEWEYACRAGNTSAFFGRHGADPVAWFGDNSGGRLHPVAGKWANPWGLYDMHGNAREWCSDIYEQDELVTSSGSPPRVQRGGSALTALDSCRAASRTPCMPHTSPSDVGFRIVCDPPS
jgi:formylglycine-generating enzyme required for sulfatase activity